MCTFISKIQLVNLNKSNLECSLEAFQEKLAQYNISWANQSDYITVYIKPVSSSKIHIDDPKFVYTDWERKVEELFRKYVIGFQLIIWKKN